MAETGTLHAIAPGGGARLYNANHAATRDQILTYIAIDDGGSRSGHSLTIPQFHVGDDYVVDYCEAHRGGEVNSLRLYENYLAAAHGLFCRPSDIFVQNLTRFLLPIGFGTCPQNAGASLASILSSLDFGLDVERTFPHSAVRAFARGIGDKQPTGATVDIAARISFAALANTVQPEITVDVDGALSFDLRLANGLLVLAELDLDGELDASVYDDDKGILVQRLKKTTESEFIDLF